MKLDTLDRIRRPITIAAERHYARLSEKIGDENIASCALCGRGINAGKPGRYHVVKSDIDGNLNEPNREPALNYIGPECWREHANALAPYEVERPETPYGE